MVKLHMLPQSLSIWSTTFSTYPLWINSLKWPNSFHCVLIQSTLDYNSLLWTFWMYTNHWKGRWIDIRQIAGGPFLILYTRGPPFKNTIWNPPFRNCSVGPRIQNSWCMGSPLKIECPGVSMEGHWDFTVLEFENDIG